MPSALAVGRPACILEEWGEVAVRTEFRLPLHTRPNDASMLGVLIGGVIVVLAALDTVGKDDALTCGWDGGIRVIDEGVPLGTLALALAVILHVEPYFGLFSGLDSVQLGKRQGEDEEEGKEEEHRCCW